MHLLCLKIFGLTNFMRPLEIEGYKVQNILDGKDRNLSNVKIEKLRVQITGPDFDNSDKIMVKIVS